MGEDSSFVSEYIAFKGAAYVYQIPPARTAAGHRADDWNVNKWMCEVNCKVITRTDDTGTVKLEDMTSGELFAECPLPKDGPISLAVETVNDSSRYFVLRVFDSVSGRHAFLGIGFRDRDLAQDFRGSLFEFEKALQRSKTAARMAAADDDADDGAAKIVVKTQDLSLKEGASIKVNLNLGKKPDSFGGARGSAAGASGSAAAGPATGLAPPPAAPVAMAPPPLPVKLAPPPAGGGLRLAPPPPGHARGAPQAAGPAAGAPPPLQPPPAAPHWPQQAPAAAGDPQLSGAAALLAPPPTLPSKPLPPPPPQPQPIVAQQHDFGDFAAFQS